VLAEHVAKPLVEVGQCQPELGRAGSGLDEAGLLQLPVQRVDDMGVQVTGHEVALEDGGHSDQGGGVLPRQWVWVHAGLDHSCSGGLAPHGGNRRPREAPGRRRRRPVRHPAPGQTTAPSSPSSVVRSRIRDSSTPTPPATAAAPSTSPRSADRPMTRGATTSTAPAAMSSTA
jgi:hypothetical protein